MIFDELGLPRDTGATDFNDSARLAGIMVLFDYPGSNNINLTHYIVENISKVNNEYIFGHKYIRHPSESQYDFSRDQAVCLLAGLGFDKQYSMVHKEWITGKDLITPSVMGHIKRCQGRRTNWFQNLWLKLDILYNAYISPMTEPNQLICMLMVAGPEYVRMWTKHNKRWQEAIREYWCGWRGEPELAALMIQRLASYG